MKTQSAITSKVSSPNMGHNLLHGFNNNMTLKPSKCIGLGTFIEGDTHKKSESSGEKERISTSYLKHMFPHFYHSQFETKSSTNLGFVLLGFVPPPHFKWVWETSYF